MDVNVDLYLDVPGLQCQLATERTEDWHKIFLFALSHPDVNALSFSISLSLTRTDGQKVSYRCTNKAPYRRR